MNKKLVTSIGRRSLLGLLAAAPVVARAAAEKADVSAFEPPHLSGAAVAHPGGVGGTYQDRLRERAKRYLSGDMEKSFRAEIRPRRLDPDIASMRSISLSAAMHMQREREVKRELEQSKANFESEVAAEFGVNWKAIVGWLT